MAGQLTIPTLEVASAATGFGLCEMTFSRMQEVITVVTGLDIFTHEMGHGPTMDRVRAEILRQFPEMPSREDAEADWEAAAAKATAVYGETVDVTPGSLDRDQSPMATLATMLVDKPAA